VTTPSPVPPRSLLVGRVVSPAGVVDDGAVAVDGAHIAYAGPRASLPPEWASVGMPEGWLPDSTLLPGLVDIHCHGGGGGEFGPDRGGATTAVAHHHRAGSTSVVGSLVSAKADTMLSGVRALAPLVAQGELAGIHLEGPFLSAARCGAQNPGALIPPDLGLLESLVAEAGPRAIAQVTWAPELPGADALPGSFARAGVVGAIGHTDATMAQVAEALEALAAHPTRGRRPLVTHLFNGMPPLHHRAPGPVGAALSALGRGEAVAEVIADGVHLADGTVQMLFDIAAPGSIALVSDSMAAAGLPEGDYSLGGLSVRVAGRAARLVEGGSLAGGVSTLLEQVRWCVSELGVSLSDAVAAGSVTPARALALAGVGSLEAGARADVVVVDEGLGLRRVMRRGSWL
jgi:N-acetylglucosamine-6-phosphate deacetylase